MTPPRVFRQPDAAVVHRLLESAGLPTADLETADLAHFFGCGAEDRPHGVVGLELLGSVALLRSLAVEAGSRGSGSGLALVASAEGHARNAGVRSVYLLTTTAAQFFERLGYSRVDREVAPPAIRRTREFGELCPATATFMVKHLQAPPDVTHSSSTGRLIDVSHTVEHGMVTYKGLPAPIICDYLSRQQSRSIYDPGTEFQIGKIEMVANTGTYIDSPFHRYADGKDLADLSLSSLADLDCIVIRSPAGSPRAISRLSLGSEEVRGRAVLFETGWDRHWRTDAYFEGHPYLTGELAEWLARSGAALVGIDSYNIDDTDDGSRPVHSVLLGRDIPIVEHLRGLGAVPERGGRFFGVPVKVRGFGTFPVRAFVIA